MPYKDPEKKRVWQRNYYKTDRSKDYFWKYGLRKKYNISPEEYEVLLNKQEGRCALCPRIESRPGYKLAVDHDHETGKIRGLLCYDCNRSLSRNRNIDYFENVIEYLKRPAEHIVEVDRHGKFVYN